MSHLQPLTLHAHPGPNPWKVAILLEELQVPYTTKVYSTPQLKQPAFLALNRNGMAPVIEDPNTGFLLAESGAIMEYVLDQYDKENRISFLDKRDHYLMRQWLEFQTTTQGPILQHIFRWTRELCPVARAGYIDNFRRVLQVLEDELADKDWLAGNKCSAADLSHVPFHFRIGFIMGDDKPDMEKEYPRVDAWQKRMLERASVKKALAAQVEALKSAFPPKG